MGFIDKCKWLGLGRIQIQVCLTPELVFLIYNAVLPTYVLKIA